MKIIQKDSNQIKIEINTNEYKEDFSFKMI